MADTRTTPPATPKVGDPATITAAGSSPAGILGAGKDEALTEAKQMVREVADEQRKRAAGAIGGMAGALHKAAGDMQAENEMIGRYTNLAAERLDQVADYLRRSDWNDVLTGAEDMARRQPYWFVGGAVATGFLLARMIKSSGAAQRRIGAAQRYGQRMTAPVAGSEAGLYPAGTAATPGGIAARSEV